MMMTMMMMTTMMMMKPCIPASSFPLEYPTGGICQAPQGANYYNSAITTLNNFGHSVGRFSLLLCGLCWRFARMNYKYRMLIVLCLFFIWPHLMLVVLVPLGIACLHARGSSVWLIMILLLLLFSLLLLLLLALLSRSSARPQHGHRPRSRNDKYDDDEDDNNHKNNRNNKRKNKMNI
jgi:membrane protein implicated in regulation of membrane protease activity